MDISVFGLGYVGSVCSVCLAEQGHQVVGVDIDSHKLSLLNSGKAPVFEPGLDELLGKVQQAGRLTVTNSADIGIADSELSIICVGTPSSEDGSMDCSYLEHSCQRMGKALAKKDAFHVFAFRSTIFPGYIRKKLALIIEQHSGKKLGEHFSVCDYPEFLREGTAIEDFNYPARRIIGEFDSRAGDCLVAMFPSGSDIPIMRVPLETAEMIKYVDNTWHGIKVAFANEIGSVCKKLDIDSHDVMKLFMSDKKLNISNYYLLPGNAFGGSCLPKDIRALVYASRELDVKLPLIDSVLSSNKHHIARIQSLITQQSGKRIGFIGVGFKSDTDDMRESPAIALMANLIAHNYQICCYDSEVSITSLQGTNKAFLCRRVSDPEQIMMDSFDDLVAQSDILVLFKASMVKNDELSKLNKEQTLIDLIKVDASQSAAKYIGICW